MVRTWKTSSCVTSFSLSERTNKYLLTCLLLNFTLCYDYSGVWRRQKTALVWMEIFSKNRGVLTTFSKRPIIILVIERERERDKLNQSNQLKPPKMARSYPWDQIPIPNHFSLNDLRLLLRLKFYDQINRPMRCKQRLQGPSTECDSCRY